MSIGIVLHEPEQPGNAGAIGRTCICAGASLHLIRPLGFYTDDRSVKRAGLDYWPRLGVKEYRNYADFLAQHPDARIWYVTTKAHLTIAEADYQDGDYLMFGKRKLRDTRRDPRRASRPLRPDPDDGRRKIPESFQRSSNRSV